MPFSFTSWGIWDVYVEGLAVAIDNDKSLGCTKEQVKKAIYGEVIIIALDAANKFNVENTTLNPEEKIIGCHKTGLGEVLAALSKILKIEVTTLKPLVDSFVENCLKFTNDNIGFLVKSATVSINAREELMAKKFPAVPKGTPKYTTLMTTNPDILEAAKNSVISLIKGCDESIRPQMQTHLLFMEEVVKARQSAPKPQAFASFGSEVKDSGVVTGGVFSHKNLPVPETTTATATIGNTL